MTTLSLPPLRLNHVFGALAVALVVLALWPWLQSPAPAESRAASDTAAPVPGLPALPPLIRFSGIAERPLFSPSRRAAPGEKASPAGPGIEQRYHLLGLVSTGDARRALLAEGKRRLVISEGGALEGWTVKRIEHDRVLLSSPAGEAVLLLQRASVEQPWVNPTPVTAPPLPDKTATEKLQR